MRVGLDGTPLLGSRTGIGRYVEELVAGLARIAPADERVLTAFTIRQASGLHEIPDVSVHHRRASAQLLQRLWTHVPFPPVELIGGRVDVFHGTNYVLPPLLRARGVVTVHDLSFLRHAETVEKVTLRLAQLVPRSVARAGAVCVLSPAMGVEVQETYGVPDSKIVVTAPGVGPGFHAARGLEPEALAALGLPPRFGLFVGSREPRKGLPLLLAAWAQLWREGVAPPLCLVGPPGWGPALDVSGLPPEAVVLPGFLSAADLPSVVASAELLAMPSVYEGFGIPPVEAFATGTPAVVSDLQVFRDNLGPLARYAAIGDLESLTDALRRTLADGRGSAADQAARQAQVAGLTWDACARAARSAYELALA
jgi:glycosyltransferase involved in cell wall biosynthesis